MNKLKKLIYIILLFFVIIQTNIVVSKAVGETFDVNLTIDGDYITKGTQFQVLISISNLSNQDGLTYVGAKLEYDNNILEYVSGSEQFITDAEYVEGINTVELTEYMEGYSNIGIYYLDAKVRDLKLTFKVKEDTTALQTAIALKEIIGTNADNQDISATAQNKELVLNIYTEATHIVLNKITTTLYVGQRETLEATILPEDVTDTAITWASSDETVVTVDQNGRITGIKEGKAAITATIPNSDVSATCEVEVIAEPNDNPQDDENKDNNDNQNNDEEDNKQDNEGNTQIKGEEQNNNSQTIEENENNNNLATQKLPYTGSSIMITLFIIIAIAIAVISFKKTKDLKGI